MRVGQRVMDRTCGGIGRITYVDEQTIYVHWDAGVTMSYPASTRTLRPLAS